MYHLIAAFFALLFSFGHAQTVRQTETRSFAQPAAYAGGFEYAVPSHEQILASSYSDASSVGYAGETCSGCSMTTDSSTAR